MDFDKLWAQALKHTEIVRTRVHSLLTTSDTQVPYVLVCESSINKGDTVVRKGEVTVTRPSIIMPSHNPQFQGFEFDEADESIDSDSLINFLMVRGISLPSLYYNNNTVSLEVFEGSLAKAVKSYEKDFQVKENVHAGLIIGHKDSWQLSLLIFVCSQVARNADRDIQHLMNEYKNKKDDNGFNA